MNRRTAQTSILAYKNAQPQLGRLQKLVYDCIRTNGPIPNKRISSLTGIAINVVTPRVKELRELTLVQEAYKAKYEGKLVMYWSQKALLKSNPYKFFVEISNPQASLFSEVGALGASTWESKDSGTTPVRGRGTGQPTDRPIYRM